MQFERECQGVLRRIEVVSKGLFMNKIFDETNVFSLTNSIPKPDKEAVKAQKQWQKDGTVSTEYLRLVLGDISVGISAFVPSGKEKEYVSEN